MEKCNGCGFCRVICQTHI
ncbi:4Fe-4S binding protein [Candidatus Woesearchaeota archaeon]|nr:4Fe-4S binding protein [Candidatus Woesearchaeota archaeon]MBT7555461.1 4Fe-4S binding protein [Candidatus Woesearchaeota archaeon]